MSNTILDRELAVIDADTMVEVYDADGTPKRALFNDLKGEAGADGADGEDGTSAPIYNNSGVISGAKIWAATTSVDTGGVWSVDYTEAGFTSAPVLIATPKGSHTYIFSITAITTTTATGICYKVADDGSGQVIWSSNDGLPVMQVVAIGN